jgi:excisionase family DNA binding protein
MRLGTSQHLCSAVRDEEAQDCLNYTVYIGSFFMEPLLSIEEAAHLLGVSPWTVRKWVSTNRIRIVRLGRRVLLEQPELRRIIEDGRAGANAEAATGAGL